MIYNFGESQSRNAYNKAAAEIRARKDITDEEKAVLIRVADGKVYLNDDNPLADILNLIRTWNEEHPEGPKNITDSMLLPGTATSRIRRFIMKALIQTPHWPQPRS